MLKKPEKIFLIICTGYFGDVILTAKLSKDIKKYYPESKLVYICDSPYISVAENLPGVDEVIEYNRKVNSYPLKYIDFIFNFPYRNKIAHSFIIHKKKESRKFLAKMLGSKKITAWEHFGNTSFSKQLEKEDPKYKKVAYFNANLLSVLTGKKTDDSDVEFIVPTSSQKKIDEYLSKFNYKSLVGINPQAQDLDKTWDVCEFIKLVRKLIECGITPVITGISKDGTKFTDALVEDKTIDVNAYINLMDKTNFCELGALYKRCSHVVSVDTGSSHMACAVGTPTTVLFYKNNFCAWAPLDTQKNTFIYNPDKITAEEVFSEIQEKLKENSFAA